MRDARVRNIECAMGPSHVPLASLFIAMKAAASCYRDLLSIRMLQPGPSKLNGGFI